jgi:tRNA 2-thiouridine synthesizing protein A
MEAFEVIKEDRLLDCSDMLCPMPIVNTTKAMKELQPGQILKMISTDAGSPPDIEAWSRQTGNELLLSTVEGGKFIFFLKEEMIFLPQGLDPKKSLRLDE